MLNSNNVISITDYGAKIDGHTDDSVAIHKAFKAVEENNGGTVIFPTGNIRISEPILIPDSGIRIQAASSYLTRITPLDNFIGDTVFYFKNKRQGNKGINIDHGLFINCNNRLIHGIIVENGYDQFSMRNVEIRNVHADYYGFYFKKISPGLAVGQTILLENCIVEHVDNKSTGPCYVFEKYQEVNLIGCKAFANRSNSVPANANYREGTGFRFIDCRGITMTGCSVAFADTAIEFIAETRPAAGLTVVGQTNEAITGNALVTKGNKDVDISNIVIMPIRAQSGKVETERSGKFNLSQTKLSTIYSTNERVEMNADSYQNIIISMLKENVYGNTLNNTIIGTANANQKGINFNDSLEIESANNPSVILRNKGGLAAKLIYSKDGSFSVQKYNEDTLLWENFFKLIPSMANNYTGLFIPYRLNGVNKFSQIKLGTADSGGEGFRALILPED